MTTNPVQRQMIKDAMQAIAERKPGRSKLVYDKAKRTIVAVAEGSYTPQALNITADDADMFSIVTLAAEWLRFLRGKRSQRGFSKRLGYRSNIAYRWESELCFPTAAETFALAQRPNTRVGSTLDAFYGSTRASDVADIDLAKRQGVAQLLRSLRGETTLVELAKRSAHR